MAKISHQNQQQIYVLNEQLHLLRITENEAHTHGHVHDLEAEATIVVVLIILHWS